MVLSKYIYTCLFCLAVAKAFEQHRRVSQEVMVLQKAIIGKRFVFGRWNKAGETEIHLTYLGNVKTRQGITYKVVNSIWYWGLSKRATSRILIFGNHNQHVGNYYLSTPYDLPQRIVNGQLIFINAKPDCDPKVITRVDFKSGLPKTFFRQCHKGEGDIFSLDTKD
jgi:hypothetical protein